MKRLLVLALLTLLPWVASPREGWAARPLPAEDGDLDDDGRVTPLDLFRVRACAGAAAGAPGCVAADLDADGDVDPRDLARVARQMGLPVCNGSPRLCERRFDEVAYATTHNAFATLEQHYFPPANQTFTMTRQLEDGVRALMLDVWYLNGGVFLCHTLPFCGSPRRSLADGLGEVRDFLAAHRGEVVALLFESYVAAADVAAAFAEAGLLDQLYVHAGGAWPTLGELVERGERLVVLTDDRLSDADRARFPWYHYLWDSLAFETPFSLTPAEFFATGFTCEDLRGEPTNDLFILNHFLTDTIGHPSFAELVNFDPEFGERARECEAFHGRIPNFVTVDYYEIGDVFDVVAALNGLR